MNDGKCRLAYQTNKENETKIECVYVCVLSLFAKWKNNEAWHE